MSRSAETAMWGDPAASARVEEYEADSVDDVLIVDDVIRYAKARLSRAHNLDVRMCAAGTIEDILAHIETFTPDPIAVIRQRARDVAWDRETD